MTKLRKLRVLRRPDGVIELRRRRLRDSAVVKDAALLAVLCLVCLGFITMLATMLVETPLLLAGTAAFLLPFIPAVLLARSGELAPAPARPSAKRPPDGAA